MASAHSILQSRSGYINTKAVASLPTSSVPGSLIILPSLLWTCSPTLVFSLSFVHPYRTMHSSIPLGLLPLLAWPLPTPAQSNKSFTPGLTLAFSGSVDVAKPLAPITIPGGVRIGKGPHHSCSILRPSPSKGQSDIP